VPKKHAFPLSSIERALSVANAVQECGGSCDKERCAQLMGKTLSGAFQTHIGSSVKYGFIENSKNILTTTTLYKGISMSYTESEKRAHLLSSFFSVPLFQSVYDRFLHTPLPKDLLPKILIREFEVSEGISDKVSKAFFTSISYLGLIDTDGVIIPMDSPIDEDPDSPLPFDTADFVVEAETRIPNRPKPTLPTQAPAAAPQKKAPDLRPAKKTTAIISGNTYQFSIKGTNISVDMTLQSEFDFDIMDAVIEKIRSEQQISR
jgi:hypothetical protein